jgi:hypothetical protein
MKESIIAIRAPFHLRLRQLQLIFPRVLQKIQDANTVERKQDAKGEQAWWGISRSISP